MRIAVVGAGLSGLTAAYELAKAGTKVCLYEKEDNIGGSHAKTVTVDGVRLDLGFPVFNCITCPNLMELLDSLGVEMETMDMSFSVSLDKGLGCEWGIRNGLSSIFAQKTNILNPQFWKMLHEMIKFNDDVLMYLDKVENNIEMDLNDTLGTFVKLRGYSKLFQRACLIPVCASVWACSSKQVMDCSAFSILSCFRSNRMFQLFGGQQWFRMKERYHSYTNKVMMELVNRGCQIRTNCKVQYVLESDKGCRIVLGDGSEEFYDGCILAVNAPDSLKIIEQQATHEERRILGTFQYFYSECFLHQDKSLMPKNSTVWSAWNILGNSHDQLSFTYWLNLIQNIDKGDQSYFVTLDPIDVPKHVLLKWSTGHYVPTVASSKALLQLNHIQGKRGIWFCGAHQGFGFHEDGLKDGMVIAHQVLGRNNIVLQNPKQMVTSWTETAARIVTIRFLRRFISVGCLVILEDGGEVFTFQGTSKKFAPKVAIRVHAPDFYWKICTEADLGIADAYINGDFSFVDKDQGLLNLFMLFIANNDILSTTPSGDPYRKRGWWKPVLFTAGIASAKSFYRHFCNQNSLTQARRNISRHYDVSNDIFSLFLGDTMQYSCAIFKSANEDLKDAQHRKMSVLIEKAKIEKNHEVLDIGCGWGNLAIEVVRRTGCKYTGITLSEEQLTFAEKKVKESGLQDHIKFILCDYREIPVGHKYDRIISCEMIEHVGHEYMEDFFRSCDSALADNGIFVLQFIAVRDYSYDEWRQTAGFIKEYIFPGGIIPSLNRVTSAMAIASTLCVEQIENIGDDYCQTLRCWRRNFLQHQSKIMSLGFDEKFIRTWEYYFDYCAAGFKSRILRDYQVVFMRPKSDASFRNPYESVASSPNA